MKTWLVAFLALMGSLFSNEVPQEENLFQTKLSNGVSVWAYEHAMPKGMASIRVVWEKEGLSHTHAIDTLFGDEEELTNFFQTCRDEVKGFCDKIGVIAVGDFSREDVLDLISTQFSDIALPAMSSEDPPIAIQRSNQHSNVTLTLAYPTPRIELKTIEDLRKQWLVFFLQAVVQSRMMQLLSVSGGIWLSTSDSHFLLPETFCKARAQCDFSHWPNVLGGFLVAVQEIRKGGFTEEEFGMIKARIQKALISGYRRVPDSATLANYYAEQFAFGKGCPSYHFFMTKSLGLIPDFTLRDIHELVMNCLTDENRRVKFFGPPDAAIDEPQVKQVLDSFKADSFVLSLETQGDVDPVVGPGAGDSYIRLPISDTDARLIGEIIDTMADKNIIQLGWIKGEMEAKGQKVNHVHPLKFLGTIFSDPHLKKCMKEIRTSYLKWNGFLGGLSRRLEEEYKRNNLFQHITGFSAVLKANPEQVRAYLQKQEWEKLVKYLLKLE